MTVRARTSIQLTQMSLLIVLSAAFATLIVAGGSDLPKIWVAISITVALCVTIWGATRSGLLTFGQMDRWAWAVLLSHTVFTSRVRDPRDLLDSNTPPADIAIEIFIWAIILAYAAFRLFFDLRIMRGLNTWTARLSMLFFAAALGSSLYAANPLITMAWSFKLLTTIVMSLVLARAEGPLDPLARFISACHTGLCLMLVQFFLLGALSPSAAYDQSDVTGILRLGGYIIPATQLSAICGMVVTMNLVDVFSGRRHRFTMPLMISSALVMILTLGRSGMIATMLALGFVVLYYRRTSRLLVLCLIAVMLAVAIPGSTDTAWDIISRRQTAEQIGSLTGRVQLWETAIELILERPFFGWGYVSGSRIAFLTAFRWWPAIHTHNAFLEILLTLGLAGASIVVLLLVSTFSYVIRSLRENGAEPNSSTRDSLVKMLALLILITADGMFTSGFAGAPRFEAVTLIGAALCIGTYRQASAT